MRILEHLYRYVGASLLLTIAGVISFPILTRIFSVEQYGLLGYVGLLLSFVVGCSKLGMQNAAVRFRSEVETEGGQTGIDTYVTTIVAGMAVSGIVFTLLSALFSQVLPDRFWNEPQMKPLLLLTSVLVLIRTLESAFMNLLKANEQSKALNIYQVFKRYVELGTILVVVLFFSRTLQAFFGATIAVELLALLALMLFFVRSQSIRHAAFSSSLLTRMLWFAVPMIGFELASVVLSMGDRLVIQALLGATDLGIYTAAYNLADYLKIVLVASIASAAMPVYMRLYEQGDLAGTRKMLAQLLRYYLMVAMPVVLGLAVVADVTLTVVASEKYVAGAGVIPWVAAGMALEGLIPILAALLYLEKRSRTLLVVVLIAAVINIAINYWLVPIYGVQGAAWATFFSYGVMLTLGVLMAAGNVRPSIPWLDAVRYLVCAGLMALIIASFSFHSAALELFVQVVVGAVVYAGLMLWTDRPARELLLRFVAQYRLGES